MLDRQPPGVEPREVEQVGRELPEPVDLQAHLREELVPGGVVQIGIVEQLQRPAQREERRSQLVRGVGDELSPRPVEPREP